MEIESIRTEEDYLTALRVVGTLIDLDPEADSPEGKKLDAQGALVQAYEAKHYPIDPPDPVDAYKFRTEHSAQQ
ncbi:MAG: hypothetical protein IPG23_13560 [Burkholderiales bacterium]|jgi:HTH-type transcriptional regulator/antitoxin HigA|nr:hypothetical protein [Burkholderiales bacterium]